MKVHDAEIVISAVSPAQYPDTHLPEIALAGRSNVGKSSFINTLINRKNLARTSSKPGKTQTLNFYLIENTLHFVDVPGYGYAKVSKRSGQSGEDDRDVSCRETAAAGSRLSSGSAPCAFSGRYSNVSVFEIL